MWTMPRTAGNLPVTNDVFEPMNQPDRVPPDPVEPDPAAGATRAERKLCQILEGARAVFREQGFGGASVDDIARRAGISKATMYRYFPDKAAIYAEVLRRDCQRQAMLMETCAARLPLEEQLMEHARRYLHLIVSPFMQDVFRAAVAESGRTPEFGRDFYASGPDTGRKMVAPVLRAAAERGEIAIEDADFAANQFFALCAAEVFYKSLFGVVDAFPEDELEEKARVAVTTFLRAHAPARGRGSGSGSAPETG